MAVAGFKFRINGGGKVNEIIDVGKPDPYKYILTGLDPDTEYTIEKATYDRWQNISPFEHPKVFTTPLISLDWLYPTYVDDDWVLNEDFSLEATISNFQPFTPQCRLNLVNIGESITVKTTGANPAYCNFVLFDGSAHTATCFSTGQVNSSDTTIQFLTARATGNLLKLKRISSTQVSYSISTDAGVTWSTPVAIHQVFSGAISLKADAQTVDNLIIWHPVFSPPDTIPPSNPTGLNATTVDNDTIGCVWTASTDNVEVIGYQLQRATNSGFTTGVVTFDLENVLTYNVDGLSASTLYYFRVRAFDGTNYSGWSNVDSDTTAAPPPTNWASAASGGTVAASSSYSANFPASAAIDGVRTAPNWGAGSGTGRGWNDLTNTSAEWIESTLSGAKTIKTFNIFFIPSDVTGTTLPTVNTTVSSYASNNFQIQYWDGAAWQTLVSVTTNDKQWYQFTHAGVLLTKWRVLFGAPNHGSHRVAEIEAIDA